jgi:hypothetical protein
VKEEVFQAYLEEKERSPLDFWSKLMDRFGYIKKDKLRSEVRRELKKRGMKTTTLEYQEPKKSPAILILDIETSLMRVFAWHIHDVTLSVDNIERDWSVICWAAKWLGDSEVMGDVCTSEEAKTGNDKRVVESIWKLVDQADIIVSFNGNMFDLKKLNTRFILNGLHPPSKYYSVDVYQTVRNNFGSSSNKLDYISTSLGFEGKIETHFDLWKRSFYGEQEALDEMFVYNQKDVTELENVYLKYLPWIKNHPNVAIYNGESIQLCPKCGNKELNWSGYYYTSTGKFSAFRCSHCGAVGRSKCNELTKEKKSNILIS